ncbi:MAG: hypothetical protein JSS66_07035 [Armatimonadetes bacterium]|nr:hypothetical protein [Armatimonadota bacterium]
MSVFAGIVNPRKALSSTVTTPATLASGTAIYVTIPWPAYSTIERIIVSCNETFSNMVVSVLSDGAAYRAASTDDQQQYILDKLVQSGSATQWYDFDATNSQAHDNYKAGYVYLLLSLSTGNYVTGSIFNVTVEGYGRIPTNIQMLDNSPYKDDKYLKVLKLTSGDTKAQDLTGQLLHNGAPTAAPDAPICFASTSDTLYIGSDRSFSAIELQVYSGAQPSSSQFTWQYYNAIAGAWTTFTPLDNTSDGQATPSEMNYSGTLGTGTLSGWGPTSLATDPLKIMMDEVLAGTRPPMGMAVNPLRYWIRATPTVISGSIKLGFVCTLK